MHLTIHGWDFDTAELSALPPYVSPIQPPAVRAVLEDGGVLARAYHALDCDCKRLAAEMGVDYRVARQALAWYGIWPADPIPLRDSPRRRRRKVRRRKGEMTKGKRIRKVKRKILTAGSPAADITHGILNELVARAYLRNDRCPPACKGRGSCLDPGGVCVYWGEDLGHAYQGNGDGDKIAGDL